MRTQLGIRTHLTQPPHSVLLDYRAHIYSHEAGGLAYHSQALPIPVRPADGKFMTLEEVKENGVWDEEIHGFVFPAESAASTSSPFASLKCGDPYHRSGKHSQWYDLPAGRDYQNLRFCP